MSKGLVEEFKKVTGFKDEIDEFEEKHNVKIVSANESFTYSEFNTMMDLAAKLGIKTVAELQEFSKEMGGAKDQDLLAALEQAVELKSAPAVKQLTENVQSFKTRKDLSEALAKIKEEGAQYKVRRSTNEDYRYDLIVEAVPEEADFDKENYMKAAKDFAEEISNYSLIKAEKLYYDEYSFDTHAPEDDAEQLIADALIARIKEITMKDPVIAGQSVQEDFEEEEVKEDELRTEDDAVDVEQSNEEDDVEPEPEGDEVFEEETGDDLQDNFGFLSNDELEAIAGYEEVIKYFEEKGIAPEKIIDKLKEFQEDEEKHLEELKDLFKEITGEELAEIEEDDEKDDVENNVEKSEVETEDVPEVEPETELEVEPETEIEVVPVEEALTEDKKEPDIDTANADIAKSIEAGKKDFDEVTSHQDGSFANKEIKALFVGGKYDGKVVSHDELAKMGNGKFSPRWSQLKAHNDDLINMDLEDQPEVDGYVGPMGPDGGMLRYETQEVYDRLSESVSKEQLVEKKEKEDKPEEPVNTSVNAETVGDLIKELKDYDKKDAIEFKPIEVKGEEIPVENLEFDDTEEGKVVVTVNAEPALEETKEPLKEEAKIISSLKEFKPWSGAVGTWETIVNANKLDALEFMLEDLYPDGITTTALNDLLWFEGDWVLDQLSLTTEDITEEKIIQEDPEGNIVEDELSESYSRQELLDAVMDAFGMSKSEAQEYIKTASEKTKYEIVKGFREQAKKDFYEGALNEAVAESKKLKEGYLGQTLQDFLNVCMDAELISKITISNTDIDDYEESIVLEEGSFDDIPDNVLEASFSDFDCGGDAVVINCSKKGDGDLYYSTVAEFLEDYNGNEIQLWSLDAEKLIFNGDKEEIPDEYLEYAFGSFDTPEYISINVHDVEEEKDNNGGGGHGDEGDYYEPKLTTDPMNPGQQWYESKELKEEDVKPFFKEVEDKADDGVDFDAEQFDADINKYFDEAYEDTVIYRTENGSVDAQGNIMLEGLLTHEGGEHPVTFTLTLAEPINEQLDTKILEEKIKTSTFTVKNNLSEEVFTFERTLEK